MITAYLVGISTYQENEDIEIRYSIFKDEELVSKQSVWRGYKKPLVVTHSAILYLLPKLKEFNEKEITIVINDGALYEQLRGTSTTKNQEVLKAIKLVKEKLTKFGNSITIKNVSTDNEELKKWNKVLES